MKTFIEMEIAMTIKLYCHIFDSISNDFIEVMGAYTYTSDSMGKIIPGSRFCGVFDGQDLLFQPITSEQFSYD